MKRLFQDPTAAAAERLRRLEIIHAERMSALESGQSLPEVAIACAEADQTWARAVAGINIVHTVSVALGPAAVCGIAVGATAVVLAEADAERHSVLITVIWTAAVLISAAVIVGLWAIGRQTVVPESLRGQGDKYRRLRQDKV